jgi:Golgi apparatus protein 1
MRSNLQSRWIGVAALVLGAYTLPAQAQSIFQACEMDIDHFCANVTPGSGRLTACIYAHEDKLSDSCDAAIAETADVISVSFNRLRNARLQCAGDVAKLCDEVAVGDGRIFACLHENKASLSDGCGEVIDHVELPAK